MKEIRVKLENTDFDSVYKIIKIGIDEIELKKYGIKKTHSLGSSDEYINIVLENEHSGIEIYKATPEVICEVSGLSGTVIKGFRTCLKGKKNKKVILDEVYFLDDKIE